MITQDMETKTIRPKAGVQLRRIGKQYIIVEANEENVNMSDVYSLNRTAARMWEEITQRDCTPDELADSLCKDFETDKATALEDVERQLAEWKAYGLIL